MKSVFIGPRAAVDAVLGRCECHAVLIPGTADWLVVAELHEELGQLVRAMPGVDALPHPRSSATPAPAALARLGLTPAQAGNTRDALERAEARHGVPTLLRLLDR